MKKNKVFVLLIIICMITIGYAILSEGLSISGLTSVKESKWDIYFTNFNIISGGNFSTANALLNNDRNELTYYIGLNKPGDKYEFTIDVVNAGTIDAMINLVSNTNLTESQSKVINYSATYIDGSEIQKKNLLRKASYDQFRVIVEYKKDIQNDDLPTSDINLTLSLNLEYTQADNSSSGRDNLNNYVIRDLSGNGNNGLLHGAVLNGDSTVTTDGVDDYINCGLRLYDFKDSISMVLRFKKNTDDIVYYDLFGNWEGAGGGISLHSNRLLFNLYMKDERKYTAFDTGVLIKKDEWNTVVATYDGSKIDMYLNGEKINSANEEDSVSLTGDILASSMPIYIGAGPQINGLSSPANITVSHALVFDRALSEEEAINDYNNVINPSNTDKLLFYYDFK